MSAIKKPKQFSLFGLFYQAHGALKQLPKVSIKLL